MQGPGPTKNKSGTAVVLPTVVAVVIFAVVVALGGMLGAGEGAWSWPQTSSPAQTFPAQIEDIGATRSSITEPPLLFESVPPPKAPRRNGVESHMVGEHPDLPSSPIETAVALIEPSEDFRRTVVPGTPLECDRFRSLVTDTGEWDPDIVLAIVWRESLCNESAVSNTNDWGLLQLNATCWAGKGNDGLPNIRTLPESIDVTDLHCDGATLASPAAQWCFHAKEQALHTGGRRPDSPCDAWLDPATNIETAYEIWRVQGWRPWCFDDLSRSTPACEAAAQTLKG